MAEAASPAETPPNWAAHAGTAATSASLTALAGVDPADLTGAELVDAIVASEKALSLLTGTQMRLLTALAKPFVAGDPMRLAARLARKNCSTSDNSPEQIEALVPDAAISLAAAEVAAALRISPVTAGIRVRQAGTMTTVLAPTLAALEGGILDRSKMRVIAEHCEPLTPEKTATVQDLVLPKAGQATTSELRDITGQAVITADPDGCDERHQAAAARRELAMNALPDAMATLKALLPADSAVKIFQVSDLLATATATAGAPGDTRGIGARRVDALVDIADQLLTHRYLDLSHYLGNPLPDHGSPRAARPTEEAGQAAKAAGGNGNTSTSSGSEGATVEAPVASTSESHGPSTAGNPTPHAGPTDAEAAEPASSTLSTTPVAADSTTPTASAGSPAHTACPAPSGSPARTAPTGSTTPTPLPATTGSAPNRMRGKRSASTIHSTDQAPCATCGSTERSNDALSRQGRRPHLSVTLSLGTLAGLDNLPGKLAGFGAIPPGLARSIAASAATITTALTDPETGTITHAGALTYRPRQELRDHIAALFGTCQFPSCRQPVWRCDIDHRDPFNHQNPEQGGRTDAENTGPYCRRHHLFKHHTQWRIRPDVNASTVIWISPTGHRYVKGRLQATPPDMWVTTAGTAVAKQLDNMSATTNVSGQPSSPIGVTEELLTATLLRHQLLRPPLEYDPTANPADPTLNDPTLNDPTLNDNDSAAGTIQHDEIWPTIDDPPPF